jgi:predicted nucleic acid-binding protein
VKLPLKEPELPVLLDELSRWDGYVSSSLLGVEAIRACAIYGDVYARDARAFLESVALLPLDELVLHRAAELKPDRLRSLDALHLATALSIRGDVGAFVTYDDQLASAARERGLVVVRPS